MPKKKQYTIRLPEECAAWLDKKVKSRIYANSSHAFEVLVLKEMKNEGLVKDE